MDSDWVLYWLAVVVPIGFLSVLERLKAIHAQLDLWLRYLAERKQQETLDRM